MIGLIIGVSIEAAVGILCIVIGLVVWLKQKVSLVHSYHHARVRKEDIPAYTRLLGIGLILIGAGILAAGALDVIFWTNTGWLSVGAGLIAIGVGFAAGLTVMHKAQKKYNGGWF